MSYVKALATLRGFKGGEPLKLLLAMSGTPQPLDVFVRAAGAGLGRDMQLDTLPFNTLGQWLRTRDERSGATVLLLCPWDFLPALDWRSGVPNSTLDLASAENAIRAAGKLLAAARAKMIYVPAPIPPLLSSSGDCQALENLITGLAHDNGATVLSPDVFSLGSYLSTGCPVAGEKLGLVADAILDLALSAATAYRKVLTTDLDNVLWHGVIAEDGIDGIDFRPEGVGYRHFLYQTLLKKLKDEGVLLVAVSRNDSDLARLPFTKGGMTLSEEDFVAIQAGYGAKSAQIEAVAKSLNLGLEAFVFVDDNPVELAEVRAALPRVKLLAFPGDDEGIPTFFQELRAAFSKTTVTAEDTKRTDYYRRQLREVAPADLSGGDLRSFLAELGMVLQISDRRLEQTARAVQLINKTTQFNLNGQPVDDGQVAALLSSGGRLFTANLSDRSGDHGEILACLVAPDGTVQSLVLSCRVFQRRVEHAFLTWLAETAKPARFKFKKTERNKPIQMFLADPAFVGKDGGDYLSFDAAAFASAHASDLSLFELHPPNR